jgi:hypothetical protein
VTAGDCDRDLFPFLAALCAAALEIFDFFFA